MAPLSLQHVNNILPKLFEAANTAHIHDFAFVKELDKVNKTNNINNLGLTTPYGTTENAAAFGMSENGSIQPGTEQEYIQTVAGLRNLWISINVKGSVMRTLPSKVLEVKRQNPTLDEKQINRLATNYAVRDLVDSTMISFANYRDYFACQGTDKSEIGVVTALPGAGNVQFNWNTTAQGNRMFFKNMPVQFFSPGGAQRVGGYAAGVDKSIVDQKPNKSGSVAATAVVHFNALPNDLAVGDTVHLYGGYATNPQGFLAYVNDTGNVKGTARSAYPEALESPIVRVNNAVLTPLHFREAGGYIEGKRGYNQDLNTRIFMNKALVYAWANHIFNTAGALTPFTRRISGTDRVEKYDPSIDETGLEWEGKKIMKDKHVPPAQFFMINFSTFRRIIQTPVKPYEYDDGVYMKNTMDSVGLIKDEKQATIFCEENFDCVMPSANARGEGFAFDARQVDQP